MREIKFRAWYEKFNEMYLVKGIDFQRKMAYFDKYNYRSIYDIELMQYTGLKDNNNKEIYEGDILSDGNIKKPHKVVFENGSFRAEFKGDFDEYFFDLIDVVAQGCEIVGNIYENPELMEDN